MHGELRRAVIPDDVARDTLAEIGLDGVHALIQQRLDLVLEPFTGGRVGEVHQAHAGLPEVGLPDFAIGLAHQIALVFVQALQRGFDVAEETLVPLEIAPMELAHPVAVVVEGGQRNITLGHTVDEGVDGGLGVLGTDLKGDMAAVVDQYAIPIGGHVERDVLVALLGSSAAILIPDVDALTILHVSAEAFAQAVYVFANRQMQLDGNEHVGFITGGTVHGHTEFADRLGGDVRFGTELESAQRLACGLSEHLAVLADEGQVPGGALDDLHGKSASGQRDVRAIDADFAITIAVRLNGHVITVAGFVGIEREPGVFGGALPVFGTHTNHAFRRCGDVHIECGQVQGIVSAAHHGGRGEDVEAFGGGIRRQFVGFTSVEGVDAVTNHPVAVGELHCCCAPCGRGGSGRQGTRRPKPKSICAAC